METKNLDIYGSEPIPWTRAREALAGSRGPGAAFFLGTVGPDATPHAAGIGAVWADGTLWFVTGPRTRKARNLAANPACTISCQLPGIDVVLEGRAERATDVGTIERLAAVYREAGCARQRPRATRSPRPTARRARPAAVASIPRPFPHRVRRRDLGAARGFALAIR